MKVCVVQCGYPEGSEWFELDPYRVVRQEWLPDAIIEHTPIMPGKDTREQIRKLIAKGYDLFINLCDGPLNDPAETPGVEIVEELEAAGIAYTGANAHFWDIVREVQKKLCKESGVPTADYRFAYKQEEVEQAINMRYPLIVKHWNGPGGSEGLSHKSRVTNAQELRDQAKFMIEKYGGCLIEEFIDGEEYTVLVSENPDDENDPIVYKPIKIEFSEGESFKTYAVKWYEYTKMKWVDASDKAVIEKLEFYSKKAFLAQKANSYGRLDWRVDKDGNPIYLEMNAQPSICGTEGSEPGSSDYILLRAPGGHKLFWERAVKVAFRDKARRDAAKNGNGSQTPKKSNSTTIATPPAPAPAPVVAAAPAKATPPKSNSNSKPTTPRSTPTRTSSRTRKQTEKAAERKDAEGSDQENDEDEYMEKQESDDYDDHNDDSDDGKKKKKSPKRKASSSSAPRPKRQKSNQ